MTVAEHIETAINRLCEVGPLCESIQMLKDAAQLAKSDAETIDKLTSQLSVAQRRLGAIGPMTVTPIQRQMMRHALGLDSKRVAYRNRYTVGTIAAEDAWNELCSRGLAVYSGGRATFAVTRAGFAHAARPGEEFDAETFDGTEVAP